MYRYFDGAIGPYLRQFGYRRLCEIGASHGDHTDRLLELDGVTISVIDPCVDETLDTKYKNDSRVTVCRGLSLDVLPTIQGSFDCIFVDGDHNWYTVYNELKTIHERDLSRLGGSIALHDIGWPYARRDGYYDPSRIPEAYRQSYAYGGIERGRSELLKAGGFNDNLENALHEGGPRNGVLTAVEDFLAEHPGEYLFFAVDVQYGFGFMYRIENAEGKRRFMAFRRYLHRRQQLGRIKRSLSARFPRVYAAMKGVRNTVRGR